jgi:type VI secretion system Hcp family effector
MAPTGYFFLEHHDGDKDLGGGTQLPGDSTQKADKMALIGGQGDGKLDTLSLVYSFSTAFSQYTDANTGKATGNLLLQPIRMTVGFDNMYPEMCLQRTNYNQYFNGEISLVHAKNAFPTHDGCKKHPKDHHFFTLGFERANLVSATLTQPSFYGSADVPILVDLEFRAEKIHWTNHCGGVKRSWAWNEASE